MFLHEKLSMVLVLLFLRASFLHAHFAPICYRHNRRQWTSKHENENMQW